MLALEKYSPKFRSYLFVIPTCFLPAFFISTVQLENKSPPLVIMRHADEVPKCWWLIRFQCANFSSFLKGTLKGNSYNSDTAPHAEFDNNRSCSSFIAELREWARSTMHSPPELIGYLFLAGTRTEVVKDPGRGNFDVKSLLYLSVHVNFLPCNWWFKGGKYNFTVLQLELCLSLDKTLLERELGL